MKILFWNPAQINCQYSDLGDIAMFHVNLEKFREEFEDLEIIGYSNNVDYIKNKDVIKEKKGEG